MAAWKWASQVNPAGKNFPLLYEFLLNRLKLSLQFVSGFTSRCFSFTCYDPISCGIINNNTIAKG